MLFFAYMGLRAIMKKTKEASSAQRPDGATDKTVYEATPDEVRDFLRSLSGGPAGRPVGQPAAGQQRVAPGQQRMAAGPAPAAGVQDVLDGAALQQAPPRPEPAPFPWDEHPPAVQAAQPAQRRRPAGPPPVQEQPAPRVRRRKAKPAAKKPKRARKAVKAEVPPVAKKAAAVTPLALRRFGLKQAVVWAEILGPPVSLRRRQEPATRTSGGGAR